MPRRPWTRSCCPKSSLLLRPRSLKGLTPTPMRRFLYSTATPRRVTGLKLSTRPLALVMPGPMFIIYQFSYGPVTQCHTFVPTASITIVCATDATSLLTLVLRVVTIQIAVKLIAPICMPIREKRIGENKPFHPIHGRPTAYQTPTDHRTLWRKPGVQRVWVSPGRSPLALLSPGDIPGCQ